MIAGAALLVLAAWSPFALLRLIPMMEVAAASVGEPALVDVRRRGLGRHPEPGQLHAAGDGPALAVVDVTRLSDDRRNDVLQRVDRATRRRTAASSGTGEPDARRGASRATSSRRHRLPERGRQRGAHGRARHPRRVRDRDRRAARLGHASRPPTRQPPTTDAAADEDGVTR